MYQNHSCSALPSTLRFIINRFGVGPGFCIFKHPPGTLLHKLDWIWEEISIGHSSTPLPCEQHSCGQFYICSSSPLMLVESAEEFPKLQMPRLHPGELNWNLREGAQSSVHFKALQVIQISSQGLVSMEYRDSVRIFNSCYKTIRKLNLSK